MKITTLLAALLTFAAGAAFAEPEPCTIKAAGDDYYREMYKQAERVVTGEVTGTAGPSGDLVLKVDKVVKGTEAKTLLLHAQKAVNTEWNGFSLPQNKPVLLFLKKRAAANASATTEPESISYDNVENYNSGCMRTFFISDGKVVLEEDAASKPVKEVKLDQLKTFLETAQ